MEAIIINELSLNGQFLDKQDFWTNGVPPFCRAIKDAIDLDVKYMYKQSQFYAMKATPNETLFSLLNSRETRIIDEAKKYKSLLSKAINDPYWDPAQKQDANASYFVGENNVSGSSIAEAVARTGCLLSFIRSSYVNDPIIVKKDGIDIHVRNIWDEKQLYAILSELGELTSKEYIISRFSGKKLDFSLIDDNNGFSLIGQENQGEFIKSFQKFIELDWCDIATDKGLDYKRYDKKNKNKDYFTDDLWKKGIWKFRITKRYRCFGYVDNGIFYVLRFDLDHKLSDVG
jgi:hypothetical protein